MKKRLIFKCSIILFLLLLVACGQPNSSSFDLAANTMINPELDGLVSIYINIEEETLIETIENYSDFSIGLELPELEYFDGENWLTVPMRRGFDQAPILEIVNDNDSFSSTLYLEHYYHPRQGQFRFRRRVFLDEYPLQPRAFHDLIVEFSLD